MSAIIILELPLDDVFLEALSAGAVNLRPIKARHKICERMSHLYEYIQINKYIFLDWI